jgi:hypothetical protein
MISSSGYAKKAHAPFRGSGARTCRICVLTTPEKEAVKASIATPADG